MTLNRPFNRINFVIAVLFLGACTEKDETAVVSKANKVAPPAVSITTDEITKLKKEAQEGDPDAKYNLAYIYENGLGVKKDEAKALELYQDAADKGQSQTPSNP